MIGTVADIHCDTDLDPVAGREQRRRPRSSCSASGSETTDFDGETNERALIDGRRDDARDDVYQAAQAHSAIASTSNRRRCPTRTTG
jgi:hypothetical protein